MQSVNCISNCTTVPDVKFFPASSTSLPHEAYQNNAIAYLLDANIDCNEPCFCEYDDPEQCYYSNKEHPRRIDFVPFCDGRRF